MAFLTTIICKDLISHKNLSGSKILTLCSLNFTFWKFLEHSVREMCHSKCLFLHICNTDIDIGPWTQTKWIDGEKDQVQKIWILADKIIWHGIHDHCLCHHVHESLPWNEQSVEISRFFCLPNFTWNQFCGV